MSKQEAQHRYAVELTRVASLPSSPSGSSRNSSTSL